ncbi:hypothetical protein DFQ27_002127 [Actinomortierella ambigua]|uniref:RING-type domain-containing protein n=1 Tax=Actinomortierella ambigua TaxID=1343610 RepID=A0A9P6Q860_9FUNG|nr:hypothetical protein DFQ27_002127 [Actinomortierella ambigua]
MTTANILASGYSNARLSDLLGATAPPPQLLHHHSLAALGGHSPLNSNNNNTPQPGGSGGGAATSSTTGATNTADSWTHEPWLAYIYRATTFVIRIPFREMIGGGDRPYDPTIEAVYPDIPLRAYRHTPSTTTLPSPPAELGWIKGRWWHVQEYFRQLGRGTRGKSRSVIMAIKFSWLLAFLYTLVLIVALSLDRDENCVALKVFLGIFVVHKIIVSLYMMDRALYRLPLDLVEHDPDIDDEQANGLAVYVILFLFALCYVYPIGYPQWQRQAPASAISAVAFAVTGFLPFYLILFVGVVTLVVLLCFYLIFICIYWPMERYGLIRRRVISRRNGGYHSDGIVNTLDLDALERTLESAVGAGFGDGKQIAVTAAIAAIPEVIYRKPRRGAEVVVPASGAGAGVGAGAGTVAIHEEEEAVLNEKERMTTSESAVASKRRTRSLTDSPWALYPKSGAAVPSMVLVDETLGSSSSIMVVESAKSPSRKLNSAEKRDQVMIQMEIDEGVLSLPGSETHGSNSRNNSCIAVESISSTPSPPRPLSPSSYQQYQQQQSSHGHQRNASESSIPLSLPCTPPPVTTGAMNSSSTPCAPAFGSVFASTSSSSSLNSNTSTAPKPSGGNSNNNSSDNNNNNGGSGSLTTAVNSVPSSTGVASATTAAMALAASMPRSRSSNSHVSNASHGSSHPSSRLSVAESGVWAQLATAGEILAAAESVAEKEAERRQHQQQQQQASKQAGLAYQPISASPASPASPKPKKGYRLDDNDIESCYDLPTECAVCLFDYEEGERLRHLRCDHYFHLDCVDRWLIKHPLCPTCRAPI